MAVGMALRSAPVLFLVLATVTATQDSLSAPPLHSLKYLYTSFWDPSQGSAHFVAVGTVDDQVFVHYDSHSRKMQPRVSWMEKVEKDDPQYWERETQKHHDEEERFRENLETLRTRYNQSEEGLHTWQLMYGCGLWKNGYTNGFMQYGYDGRTFITFDKELLTWEANVPQARETQREWDALPGFNQKNKFYLEEECIEWLKKYLSYGKERLLGTEPPVVTVSRTEAENEYICRAHGFYPRSIGVYWRWNTLLQLQNIVDGTLAPNTDGTYHDWVSIRIDPNERHRYQCRVEHESLQEPLDVSLKDVGEPVGTSP